MPFYEYQCEQCGHELEVLQKISDPLLTDCPECAQPALKKLVSAAGFRLKGSGWYETDFKGGKKNLHKGGEKKDADPSQDTKQDKSGNKKKPAAEAKAPAAE